ncbi:Integral membrane protein OS=Streptomyces lavendulae subsp. lavendulae OX=58340 GN=SLAV_18375 PE=4 SV=1 [Streptomyces lavendulae subsp. lavendulae]
MSGTGSTAEVGTPSARSRALAVLRVRSRALAAVLLPAALAVVLVAARMTGRLAGDPWPAVTLAVCAVAALVLLAGGIFGAVVLRARPAVTPTVPLSEAAAPDLYRLVRDLADRMDVPAPSAIALTPDCDSWLEDRAHAAHRRAGVRASGGIAGPAGPESEPGAAPVLVIGSPFLWWMRVAELRAVLAPGVAGTGPSAHPDIADARGFVRGLDAAVDVGSRPGLGWIAHCARLLLRLCRTDAAEMERGVAAAAADRAQGVDYGLRIVAQEQVGLAYAGWDRLLTRVALPAWRMGRWPAHLDAGVVSALTELSRRDRLADEFTSRLGERPACDLLEQPGAVDEATSLLAARLFHGGPAEAGPDWSPVDWAAYPEEVVDRKWRTEAARLHTALDALSVPAGLPRSPATPQTPQTPPKPPVPARTAAPSAAPRPAPAAVSGSAPGPVTAPAGPSAGPGRDAAGGGRPAFVPPAEDGFGGPTLERVLAYLTDPTGEAAAGDALAGRIGGDLAREERAAGSAAGPGRTGGADTLPLFPLQPPRSGRDLLADHVTALVCCAAVDSAGAAPGLDWLDGPVLLVGGRRRADLAPRVLSLVEDGDPAPLREWLAEVGVRPEKPVRLV